MHSPHHTGGSSSRSRVPMLSRMANLASVLSSSSASPMASSSQSSSSPPSSAISWDAGSTAMFQDCVALSGANGEIITMTAPPSSSSMSSPLSSFLEFSGAPSSLTPIITILSKEPIFSDFSGGLSSLAPVVFEVKILKLEQTPFSEVSLSSVSALLGNSSNGVIVGVAPSYFHSLSSSAGIGGSILGLSGSGWGYVSASGEKLSPLNLSEPYGEPFKEGDAIQCRIDPAMNTIEFFKNGMSQGVAFSNDELSLPLFAAVTISGSNTSVSIKRVSSIEPSAHLSNSSGPVGLPISLSGTSNSILQKIQTNSHVETVPPAGVDWFEDLVCAVEILSVIQGNADLSLKSYELIFKGAPGLRCSQTHASAQLKNVSLIFMKNLRESIETWFSQISVDPSTSHVSVFLKNFPSPRSESHSEELLLGLTLRTVNRIMLQCSPFLALDCFNPGEGLLTNLITDCKELLFDSVKSVFWKRSIEFGAVDSSKYSISIDNSVNASKVWEHSFFYQLYQQCKEKPSILMIKSPWKIVTKSGLDLSFEELVLRVSEELQQEDSPFTEFIEYGKKVYLPGENADLEQLQFVGRLFGLCLRVGSKLRLQFSALLWRKLMGEDVANDLLLLSRSKNPLWGHFKQVIESEDLSFSEFSLVESQMVNLDKSLAKMNWENRHIFFSTIETEFVSSITLRLKAIQEGFNSVISPKSFLLHDAQELEKMVTC
eukprot:TRINITY_DN20251_c0_g2_i5.p1 TRINITY_DN20251_c0_g2~~TRINITY_DN20251_c0_g2_i5.p1  ORF type:complete len:713 (+),score=169.67 TRINITY_DN20251_c0_g2_i5:527-2665(+)